VEQSFCLAEIDRPAKSNAAITKSRYSRWSYVGRFLFALQSRLGTDMKPSLCRAVNVVVVVESSSIELLFAARVVRLKLLFSCVLSTPVANKRIKLAAFNNHHHQGA
jgi:hypothetical protein